MSTGMNFWDMDVWRFVLTLALILLAMILAHSLRSLVPCLKKMLLPSSVLGGFLLLFIMFLFKTITGRPLIDTGLLETMTYHGLGLGFAAMTLRNIEKKRSAYSKTGAFDTGVTVVGGYLLQGILGLLVTIPLSWVMNTFFASGLLLPMGYGQGPGQAYNWGRTYEVTYGFTDGTSFGLTLAAMGFVSASIGGIIYLNRLRKKGLIEGYTGDGTAEKNTLADFEGQNEIPLSESMDKFTVQMALVFGSYALAYGFMYGFNCIIETGVFGGLTTTVQSLIWGFQFLFSTLAAILVKSVFRLCRKKGIIHREYTNNFMMNRIAGFMFDVMVVASIAAIDLSAFINHGFFIPLVILCVLGAVATYFYLYFVCREAFPGYEREAFIALYGTQTGTASTGTILLREIDPQFKTQAADNLVYHQLWAVLLGFPFMIMMGIAAESVTKCLVVEGIAVVLFAIMLTILFRRRLFRKK